MGSCPRSRRANDAVPSSLAPQLPARAKAKGGGGCGSLHGSRNDVGPQCHLVNRSGRPVFPFAQTRPPSLLPTQRSVSASLLLGLGTQNAENAQQARPERRQECGKLCARGSVLGREGHQAEQAAATGHGQREPRGKLKRYEGWFQKILQVS